MPRTVLGNGETMELIKRKVFRVIPLLWLRVKEFYESMDWGRMGGSHLALSGVWEPTNPPYRWTQ